ncbi:K1958-like protein [Mya arenaria]|uniref:K1958-like protein n=1 Tax=Mya arenaria TaxID=6604 RepID=A0ABY7G026_MYAAR|nr:K1958-like protein [Mya arenaria]
MNVCKQAVASSRSAVGCFKEMDELSQGTFDVIWDDLLKISPPPAPIREKQLIKEVSNKKFNEINGFDISKIDTFFENSIVNTVSMQSAEPSSKTGQPCPEFVELTSDDERKLIEDEENKNTMKKTLSDVQKFERFLLNKGEKKAIYQIEPDLLDQYVANYILSVRKADGAEYEPTSIRNIVSSLDRKLKRHKYPFRLIAEQTNAFQLTRDALRAKTKSLKKILGPSSAASLLNTVWINNCIQFGLRGTKENHDLRWGDVELKTSSSGLEYLALNERQTNTRTGSNIKDVRDVTPKMFAMPEDIERCPVHAYKQYAVQRPTDFCTSDDPFYIAPRTSSQSHVYDHEKWFVKMKLGEKKLGGLLKKMASDGGLDSNKRITNHSTRKHLIRQDAFQKGGKFVLESRWFI